MAMKRVCDWCGVEAPDKPPTRNVEWAKMLEIMGKVDCCEAHEAAGQGTDWKALITEAVNQSPDPKEDGSLDKPFFFQSGMDVKKNLYYHAWGHEYSAIKSVANCTVEPGHDGSIWQYVRPWPAS